MILRAATTAGWFLVAMIGASCIATLALHRGETINAIWMVAAAISVFAIAYRFYARFIAHTGLGIDPTRATPAHRRNEPAFLPLVLAEAARCRGETTEALAVATTTNACRFFGLELGRYGNGEPDAPLRLVYECHATI